MLWFKSMVSSSIESDSQLLNLPMVIATVRMNWGVCATEGKLSWTLVRLIVRVRRKGNTRSDGASLQWNSDELLAK